MRKIDLDSTIEELDKEMASTRSKPASNGTSGSGNSRSSVWRGLSITAARELLVIGLREPPVGRGVVSFVYKRASADDKRTRGTWNPGQKLPRNNALPGAGTIDRGQWACARNKTGASRRTPVFTNDITSVPVMWNQWQKPV